VGRIVVWMFFCEIVAGEIIVNGLAWVGDAEWEHFAEENNYLITNFNHKEWYSFTNLNTI